MWIFSIKLVKHWKKIVRLAKWEGRVIRFRLKYIYIYIYIFIYFKWVRNWSGWSSCKLGWVKRYFSYEYFLLQITWCEMHYFVFTIHIEKMLSSTNWYMFKNYKSIQIPTLLTKKGTNKNEYSLPFENIIW